MVRADARRSSYEQVRSLSRSEVDSRLRAAQMGGLAAAVHAGVEALREQTAATGTELNHKFQTDGVGFEMDFGSLDTFFGGLEGLIGAPQMLNGSLLASMAHEHCGCRDARVPFTSSNGLSTTSEMEWEFVHAPCDDKAYPERAEFRTPSGQEVAPDKCRRRRSVGSLLSEMSGRTVRASRP